MQDQPRTSGADQQVTSSETARTGIWSRFSAEALKLVGGLVALAVGLLVLCLIAAGAFIADPGHAGSIATAAFGVIGSIVGAYFGVKIGTDGTKEALEAHQLKPTRLRYLPRTFPAS